jgi:hypothetical protein
MARRKKSGNALPADTLERARKNAGLEADNEQELAEAEAALQAEASNLSVNERSARRKKSAPAQLERSRQRGELTAEIIEDALANPSIEVSEESLRQDYSHVLVDLRNMAVLAALLIAVIVGLNFVI